MFETDSILVYQSTKGGGNYVLHVCRLTGIPLEAVHGEQVELCLQSPALSGLPTRRLGGYCPNILSLGSRWSYACFHVE